MRVKSEFFDRQFSEGLLAWSNQSFPKRCPDCKTVYKTRADYLATVMAFSWVMSTAEAYVPMPEQSSLSNIMIGQYCQYGKVLESEHTDLRDRFAYERKYRDQFAQILWLLVQGGRRKRRFDWFS